MPDSQKFQPNTRVRIVTLSNLRFCGPVQHCDDDTLTILDEKTAQVMLFSFRGLERVEVLRD